MRGWQRQSLRAAARAGSTAPGGATRPPLGRSPAPAGDAWRPPRSYDGGTNGAPAAAAAGRRGSGGGSGSGGGGGGGGGKGGSGGGARRRDTLMEKLKRVASQPSLAIAAVPRMVNAAGGALAPALGAGSGPAPAPAGGAPAGRAGSADGDRLAAGAALLTRRALALDARVRAGRPARPCTVCALCRALPSGRCMPPPCSGCCSALSCLCTRARPSVVPRQMQMHNPAVILLAGRSG